MKKKICNLLLIFTIYILLLIALVHSERGVPGAGIQTFSDALWYSIVTLTTVGYGDVFPVSGIGKAISTIFILCSLGLVSAVIGAALSLLSDKIWPLLLLYRTRHKFWNVFSSGNDNSIALAEELHRQFPEEIIIFLMDKEEKNGRVDYGSFRAYHIGFSPEQILNFNRRDNKSIRFFFMENDEYSNFTGAHQKALENTARYCMASSLHEHGTDNIVYFQKEDCLSRLFWMEYPITDLHENIVLIGCGKQGESLLERGLLANIIHPDQAITYHVFGDFDHFISSHYQLGRWMDVEIDETPLHPELFTEESRKRPHDKVIFHSSPWNYNPEILLSADRIIIDSDIDSENFLIYQEIRTYFDQGTPVYIRLEDVELAVHLEDTEDCTLFGNLSTIFKPEFIMQQQMTKMAKQMNDIYRDSVGGNAPTWDQLSPFLKQSNIAAADHMCVKLRILLPEDDIHYSSILSPDILSKGYRTYLQVKDTRADEFRRIEHERWSRFHVMNNWSYAEKRDNSKRKHPMLVPFDQLNEENQIKDSFAWDLLEFLSKS